MKLPKKRKWPHYLMIFSIFTVADIVVSLVIDQHNLRHSLIQGLVSGVIFTGLWWLLDGTGKEDKE